MIFKCDILSIREECNIKKNHKVTAQKEIYIRFSSWKAP